MVERDLAKVEVAGSSPVIRSKKKSEDFCPRFSFSTVWRTRSRSEASLRAGRDVFGFDLSKRRCSAAEKTRYLASQMPNVSSPLPKGPRFSFSTVWRTRSRSEASLRAGRDVFGFGLPKRRCLAAEKTRYLAPRRQMCATFSLSAYRNGGVQPPRKLAIWHRRCQMSRVPPSPVFLSRLPSPSPIGDTSPIGRGFFSYVGLAFILYL